jgi:anti-anti-sigma factor
MQDVPLAKLEIIDERPCVRGEIDLSNADEFEEWLRSFGRAAIDIDLSAVTFFGASALRALLAASQRNPNLRVAQMSPIVQRVLDVTGTTAFLVDGTLFP